MVPPKRPRCRAKRAPAFIFVDASNVNSTGELSQNAKVSVRKQAARSGSKCHKLERPDVFVPVFKATEPGGLTVPVRQSYEIPPQLSLKGYDSLRAAYNFDILDLATFTEVDLANNAHLLLQNDSSWCREILKKSPSSFLAYLPSRYGQDTCLDDAIRCVAARGSQMIGLSTKRGLPDSLYGKALKSLQKEIGSGSVCPTVNSYCATRLLILYELLGQPHTTRLVTHLRGSVQLLGLRKAAQGESRFDRALLRSQGPSIVVDELYRMRASMFEDLEWQRLFQHASTLEEDYESSAWWNFFGIVTFLPGILKDMRILFDKEPLQDGISDQSAEILKRATIVYRKLHEANVLYQCEAPHPSSLFDLPISAESSDRTRLREFFLYTMIYICRVRATLSPDRMERALNEGEAQTFANQALLIGKVTKELDRTMAWHFEQRKDLAESVVQTRVDWLSDLANDGDTANINGLLAQRWLKWEDSWRNKVLHVEYGE